VKLTGDVCLQAINSLKQSQDMSYFMCSRFVIFTLHTVCDVQDMRHWILIGLQKIHIL